MLWQLTATLVAAVKGRLPTESPGVSGACKHSAARAALLQDALHSLQARQQVLRSATFKFWREQTLRALLWRRAQRLAVHEEVVRVVAVRKSVRSIFAQVGCPSGTGAGVRSGGGLHCRHWRG